MTEKIKPSKSRKCLESPILWNILIIALAFVLVIIYVDVTIKKEVFSLKEAMDCRHHAFAMNRSLLPSKSFTGGRNASISRVKRDGQSAESSTFTAAHLTGYSGRNIRRSGYQSPQRGSYFRWSAGGLNSFSTIELETNEEGTFAVIFQPGFYYVYSQIRYEGLGLYPAGHKTVRINHVEEKTLMSSVTTQQLSSAATDGDRTLKTRDSSFHSGIFYLSSREKIAVKPHYRQGTSYIVGDDASFFGLLFLHE